MMVDMDSKKKRKTPLISMYVYILFRYHESMLECCRPLEEVRKDGIGFDELACLARCNSLRVITKRPMHRHEYDEAVQTWMVFARPSDMQYLSSW